MTESREALDSSRDVLDMWAQCGKERKPALGDFGLKLERAWELKYGKLVIPFNQYFYNFCLMSQDLLVCTLARFIIVACCLAQIYLEGLESPKTNILYNPVYCP